MSATHHDALSVTNDASVGGDLSVTGDLNVDGNFDLAGGLSLTDDDKLQLRDSGIYINSSADGQLDIDSDGEVEIYGGTNVDIDAGTGTISANTATGAAETASGAITIQTGAGGSSAGGGAGGAGGDISITGGAGGAGDATHAGGDGADVTITAGAGGADNGGGAGSDGQIKIQSDMLVNSAEEIRFRDTDLKIYSSTDGQLDIDADHKIDIEAPNVVVTAPTKFSVNNGEFEVHTSAGKPASITIGNQTTENQPGGDITFTAGEGNGTGDGGSVSITAGSPEATTGTGDGGDVNITAGDAVSGDKNGGNVNIIAGAKSGTGTDGLVKIESDMLLNTDIEVQFRDSDLAIYSSVDGQLHIKADDGVVITAPNLELNGSDSGLTVRQVAKALYEFSEYGGSQGTIGLGVTLPTNAVVTKVFYKVTNAFTSGGAATVEFGFTGDTDAFVAQAAFDNAAYGVGWHDGTPDDTATNFVDSSGKEIAITIGTADLTAGEVLLWLEYVVTY